MAGSSNWDDAAKAVQFNAPAEPAADPNTKDWNNSAEWAIANDPIEQAARANAQYSAQTDPQQSAEAQQIGKLLGAPSDTVYRNLQEGAQLVKLNGINHVISTNPILKEHLAQNRDFAGVAGDDMHHLDALSKAGGADSIWMATAKGLASSYNTGALAVDRWLEAYPRMADALASVFTGRNVTGATDWWQNELIAPVAANQRRLALAPNSSFGAKALYAGANTLGLLDQIMLSGGGGEAPAVAARFSADAVPSVAETAQTAIAHGVRSMALPSMESAVNVAHDVYQHTQDPVAALDAALSSYTANTAMGIVPMSVPGGLLKRMASGAVVGAGLSEISRRIANEGMPAGAQTPFSAEQTAIGAIIGAVLGVGGPHAQQTGIDAMRAYDAAHAQAVLDRMARAAEASKVRKLAPEQFQEFAKKTTVDAPDVYIPADAAESFFQSHPNAIKAIEGTPAYDSLQESLVTGADVKIPTPDYLTHLADYHQELRDNIKLDPEGMTMAEAHDWTAKADEEIKQEAVNILAKHEQDKAFRQSADEVYQHVKDQLEATGRMTPDAAAANAALHRAFAVTMANRLGIEPAQVYERYGLQVQANGLPADAQAYDQSGRLKTGTPEFKNWFGDSKVVDQNGHPLVVHHAGTFDENVDAVPQINGSGFHFGTHAAAEERQWGKNLEDLVANEPIYHEGDRYFVDSENWPGAPAGGFASEQDAQAWLAGELAGGDMVFYDQPELPMTATYLSIKNPKRVPDQMRNWEQAIAQAKQEGYDGLVYRNQIENKGSDSYVAFEPSQIKSVNNRGTFNPNDPNILHQSGYKGVDFPTPLPDGDPLLTPTIDMPGREDLRAGIVQKIVDVAQPVEGRQPVIYLMGGGGAAGKGHVLEDLQARGEIPRENIAHIDPDQIKGQIPEYNEIVKRGDARAAGVVHEESSLIRKMAEQAALERQSDIVLDVTLGDPKKALQVVDTFQSAGYHVRLVGVTVPLDMAVERARARGERTGRYVYLPALRDAHRGFSAGFEGLAHKVDRVILFDTSTGESIPIASGADGKLVVLDKQRYSEFGRKAHEQESPEKHVGSEAGRVASQSVPGNEHGAGQGVAPEVPGTGAQEPSAGRAGQPGERPGSGSGSLDQPNRGAIRLLNFPHDPAVVTLLEHADLSTFLHESGHFFFEVMRDVASGPDAPEPLRKDMEALVKFAGTDSLEHWNKMTLEERRAGHEKIAEAFERYLFEGKAPSTELRGAFQRFRDWLLHVYQSLRGLGANLTPEVRGVFDRMLASEQQIEATAQADAYTPLFKSLEESGMSPAEWERYQELNGQWSEDAKDALQRRSLRDMQWLTNAQSKALKRLQRDAREKRNAVRAEVTDEVMSQPIYAAEQFLKTGTIAEAQRNQSQRRILEEAGIQGEKLSLHDLKAMYGEDPAAPWRYLATGKKGLVTAKGGLHPDLVAELFGFSSGDELVRSLLAAEKPKDLIDAMTDQRMLERYGDLNNPDTLQRAAEEAVHDSAHMRFLATELVALRQDIGNKSALLRAVKTYAEQSISGKTVGELRPNQYLAAERKAGRAAEKALQDGDRAGAAEQKRAQVLNAALYRAARDAQAEVERGVTRMKRLASKRGTRKNLRGDALEQLDYLLARFDLRQNVTQENRKPLGEWVKTESERLAAVMPELDSQILDDGYRKPYKEMTLEQFRGLRDAVKQLEQLARREQKMYLAIRNQTFAEEKAGILHELAQEHPEAFDAEGNPVGFDKPYRAALRHKGARFVESFDANMMNLENLAQIAAGGRFGALHDSVVERLSERADWKITKTQELGDYINPFLKQWNVKERIEYGRRPIYIPEIGDSLTKEQMLTAALYYGSAEGRQRLAGGHGWGDVQMRGIISRLDERDWKMADALWRMMDEQLWPELEALDKRTKGVAAPKVEAVPFETPSGTARGGYWPLRYDADLDYRQQHYDLSRSVEDMLGGTIFRPSTQQGHSHERLAEVNKRLVLDFSGMNAALGDTLHDLAFREAIADTYRILSDKEIRGALDGILGPRARKEMETRVREVAAAPRDPQNMVDTVLYKIRRNSIITMMGLSVKTALVNFTGIFSALSRVPTGALVKETARFANPLTLRDSWKFVMDRSEYMRNRAQDYDRDIRTATQKLSVKGKLTPSLATYMSLIGVMDRAVAVPVWRAAYGEAVNGRVRNIEAGDADRAAKYADHIVRETQGSGRAVDLAKIQTGGEAKKALTMFYSFFGAQLQLLARSAHLNLERGGMGAAKLAADFGAIVIVPAITSALLYGHCLGGKESEAKCLTRETALYFAGFFPIFRDVAVASWNYADPDAPHYGYRMSPIGEALDAVSKLPASAYHLVEGGAKPADAHRVLMGLSYAVGLPGLQIWRTFNHLEHVYEGQRDFNPWYLIMGEPPKQ